MLFIIAIVMYVCMCYFSSKYASTIVIVFPKCYTLLYAEISQKASPKGFSWFNFADH